MKSVPARALTGDDPAVTIDSRRLHCGADSRWDTLIRRQEKPEPVTHRAGYIAGVILVIIGLFFLLNSFGWLWWFRWGYVWPVIVIAIGLLIIFRIVRKK